MLDRSWETLSSGGQGGVILAVDYSISGRLEAGFRDLAAELGPSATIWETVPPPTGTELTMSGTDYVERWVSQVRQAGKPVSAVLGYCVSCSFAAAIAAAIGQWQGREPQLVLFDPSPANVWTILQFGYFKILEGLADTLGEEEMTQAHQAGIQAATECGDDMHQFRDMLVEGYEQVWAVVLERVNVGPGIRRDMIAYFRKYISYLIATGELDGQVDLSGAVVLNSSAPREPIGPVARQLQFDVDHAELLRSHEVAATITDLLRAPAVVR